MKTNLDKDFKGYLVEINHPRKTDNQEIKENHERLSLLARVCEIGELKIKDTSIQIIDEIINNQNISELVKRSNNSKGYTFDSRFYFKSLNSADRFSQKFAVPLQSGYITIKYPR